MEIRINEEDQLKLLQELKHLRQQVTELQTCNTGLLSENRDCRAIIKRLDALPDMTAREARTFEDSNEQQRNAFLGDELRRSSLWMRLRGAFGVFE